MSKSPRSSLGQAAGPSLDRKGPQRAVEKHDDDVTTASWLDAAITLWGKSTAYAEAIGVDLAHLSRMRTGEKPTSLRHLLPLLGHVEAVLAFVAPLLESIGYVARPVAGPTFVQLAGAVLADLDDGSAVTRALIERAAGKRGWSAEQVQMALHKEGDK